MRTTVCRTGLCLVLALALLAGRGSCLETSAASAILVEQSGGRVLYERDADQRRLIASITKIMTALVALEHGDLSSTYTVTAEDMAEGSSMYLKPGDQLTLEELLYGLMLSSGNDAALAAAHCVSGELEDFVALMNETAQALGMADSHFSNPNGLDAEDHYSTARDMARLTCRAMENADFCRIVSTASVTIGDRYLQNHNKLLRTYRGCLGVKTGFTKAAGRTLVSAAQRDGMTLICVTLSDGDDWRDHAALLDYGFETYHMETAVPAGRVLASVSVTGSAAASVPLAADRDLACPLTGEERLRVAARLPVSIPAPVVPGQKVGEAVAYLDGQEMARVDLVAAAPAARLEEPSPERGSFWDRLFDRS